MNKLFGILIVALLSCNFLLAVEPPGSFLAFDPTDNTIDVSWTLNLAGNIIMIATNTVSFDGAPANGSVYPIGTTLPGGGGVIYYSTNNLSGTLTNLDPNTTYYLEAWSVKVPSPKASQYSTGLFANATTTPEPGMIFGLVLAGLAMVRARSR